MIRRQNLKRAIRGYAAALLTLTMTETAMAQFNDGQGKEWRQVGATTGLSWEQVAMIAPQDGMTPAVGSVAGRDLTGWVWATEDQVAELFSLWAPAILESPELSVSGPEYIPAAAQFHTVMLPTYRITGCPTYQPCFNYTLVSGWTARSDGAGVASEGLVWSETWGWIPSAGFSIQSAAPSATSPRGVFLWRSTGLIEGGIYAHDDVGQSPSPLGGVVANVFANDWIAGVRPTSASVILSQVSEPQPGVSLSADGSVVVAAGTGAGTYLIEYQICDRNNPSLCDTAVVTITVKSAPILANPDSGFASFAAGGTSIANVLVNDRLGGLVPTTAIVILSQVGSSSPGIRLNPDTGAVTVAAGTSNAVHTLIYSICERANPANCSQTTVTLRPYAVDAVNDSYRVSSKTGGSTASVLNNDWFNGVRATAAKVRITLLTTLPRGMTFNAATGVFTVPSRSSAVRVDSGVYTLRYRIHEIASPGNFDEATVTLDVSGKGS